MKRMEAMSDFVYLFHLVIGIPVVMAAGLSVIALLVMYDHYYKDKELVKMRKGRYDNEYRMYYHFKRFYKDNDSVIGNRYATDMDWKCASWCTNFDYLMEITDSSHLRALRSWYEFRKVYEDPTGEYPTISGDERLERLYYGLETVEQTILKDITNVRFGIRKVGKHWRDDTDLKKWCNGAGERRIIISHGNNRYIGIEGIYLRAYSINSREMCTVWFDKKLRLALNKACAPCSYTKMFTAYLDHSHGDIIVPYNNQQFPVNALNNEEIHIRID